MSLDLNDLMLTDQRLANIVNLERREGRELEICDVAVAVHRAAVAKALWGLQDWLDVNDPYPWGPAYQLKCTLEAAGIQRPGGKNADD